ncbi:MAG: hypothetical protein HUK25_07600 [Treponema sp.]|nr:hypothetical protein [Treponema sp.]
MKITKLLAACVLTVSVLAGCSSTKTDMELESADSYGDSVSVSEEGTKISTDTKADNKKKKKSSGFTLKNLFKAKFEEIDSGSIFTTKALGGIKQNVTSVVIYPKEEMAGFGSAYMAAYYYLVFDQQNRQALAKYVEQYFSDFENKKLNRDNKNSQKAYGKIQAKVVWGTIKGNTPNYCTGTIYIGYKFVDKSPYFTLSMDKTINEVFLSGNSSIEESLQLHYFLTKNQASSLVASLSDEKVSEAFRRYQIAEFGVDEDSDLYDEDSSEENVVETEVKQDASASLSEEETVETVLE